MQKGKSWARDMITVIIILSLCFCVSLLMQDVFDIPEQVTTTFAFAVFLISLLTDGYFWGLAASLTSVLLVNYAFSIAAYGCFMHWFRRCQCSRWQIVSLLPTIFYYLIGRGMPHPTLSV